MSYLYLALSLDRPEPLDLAECMAMIGATFGEIERRYTCGDLAEIDRDAGLARRFRDAENGH